MEESKDEEDWKGMRGVGRRFCRMKRVMNAADGVTLLGAAMNLWLSMCKLIVGVRCHLSALVADAGHSLLDLLSDFITLWAVRVGKLPPDEDAPYRTVQTLVDGPDERRDLVVVVEGRRAWKDGEAPP